MERRGCVGRGRATQASKTWAELERAMVAADLRRRAGELLEHTRDDDWAGKAVDLILILLITGNVVAVVLESIPGIAASYGAWFHRFELFSIAVFTVEYVLRVWSAIEQRHPRYKHPLRGRLRYIASPMAVIDLLAILPFYLSFLFPIDLRVLRVLRLVRMFKLTRYSPAMNLLLAALREESQAIAAALFVLMLLLILASSLAYLAEHEAQPQAFGTIPRAMWWAIVTLTTVGYGDVVPITPWGKVVGGLVGIIGIGMVALPAGLLASGFSDQLHERRREFETAVDRILASGTIGPEEGHELRRFRDRLGLSDHQAAEIVRFLAHARRAAHCPHCGQPLGPTPIARDDPAGRPEPHAVPAQPEPALKRAAMGEP
jgi:voltage-gated potassium channel